MTQEDFEMENVRYRGSVEGQYQLSGYDPPEYYMFDKLKSDLADMLDQMEYECSLEPVENKSSLEKYKELEKRINSNIKRQIGS
jgi:hypothetical protein